MSEDRPDVKQMEALWSAHRPRLLNIGYRMLGTVSEASDVADEAYARLAAGDLDAIDDALGWLVSVTSRLCIDRLRSAERSRRAYPGPWLPEPIVESMAGAEADPADRITLDDSVRMALLVVLEQLTPAERTAFVLHDVFSLPFDEIAELVCRSPAACRQLASRARRRIEADPASARRPADTTELDQLARRFAEACSAGEIEPLLDVLDPDVVGDFDSGGHIPGAPLRAAVGARAVASILVRAFAQPGLRFGTASVNGEPGVVVTTAERIVAVIFLSGGAEGISHVHGVGNPEKLRHLSHRIET